MQVKWTQRALKRLNIAVNYGLREFGETTTHQFYERIKRYEPLLATNPYMGKVEKVLENPKYNIVPLWFTRISS